MPEYNLDFFEAWDKLDNELIQSNYQIRDKKGIELNTRNYIDYLNNIISQYGRRRNKAHSGTGNYHVHHIWPTKLGGEDTIENTVVLTFSEHLKAHIIFALDNPKCYELQSAAERLLDQSKDGISIKDRQLLSKNLATNASWNQAGQHNSNYNNLWDEEQKQKHSELMNNKHYTRPIEIIFNDGTIKEFQKAKDVAEFLDYSDTHTINKWCANIRPIPKQILADFNIKAIQYKDLEDRHISSTKLVGIDINTGESTPVFNGVSEAAKYIAEKNGISDIDKLVGGIDKSLKANKPISEKDNLNFAKYKHSRGYFWIDANISHQYKNWLKKYINTNK